MSTLDEIRAKINATRANLNDKVEWESELKVILNDIIDGLQSGQVTFSNGLSAGKLGGELSDSQTTITFPDATNNMMQIGTITDGNNGGVLLELANQFDNSDFHFSITAMLFNPDFQQGLLQANAGGMLAQALNNNGESDITVVYDSATLMSADYNTGDISQLIVSSTMITLSTIQALFDAFVKAKSYQYTSYTNTTTALANIPEEQRTPGMTFYATHAVDPVSVEWMFEGGITDSDVVEKNSRYFRGKKFTGPTYADDVAAGAAGLVAGEIYKRSTGEIAVKL